MKLSIQTMINTIWKILTERSCNIKTSAIGTYDSRNETDKINAILNMRLFCLEDTNDLLNFVLLIL